MADMRQCIHHNRRLPQFQITMDEDCYCEVDEIDEYEFLFDHSAESEEGKK